MKKKSVHSLHGKFINLIKLYEKLQKIPRKFGTDDELSPVEIHLIELIGENKGLSVTGLANLHGVTKGAVSQSLKRLESRGFIEKHEDPENMSRSLIELTNKGKTAYYAHKHWHDTMDGGFKEYFTTISQDKIDFMLEFLDRMESFLKQRILTEK